MKGKIIFLAGILVSLAIAYGLTMAPGLSWANGGADGGDLITAAFVNGVPHPTGYPLYLLFAKFFFLFPVGNLAFRTNLLSAFCTILSALLIFITVDRLLVGKKYANMGSSIAALAFGLSPLVWSQAVITEVYGLQSLLTIGILYQALFFGNKTGEDILRGLLFGLALGNHITTILLLPVLFWDKKTTRFSPIAQLLIRLIGLLLGSTIYILLPLYARSNPVINWVNPVTLKSFFELISGQIYQSYFSLSFVIERIRGWAGLLIEQFGIPGIAIGLFALMDSERSNGYSLPIIWIFISYGAFALIYTSYDSYVYLIPTVLAFSLWIGLGFDTLINYIIERWQEAMWIIAPLIIVLLAWHISSVAPVVDASKDTRAEVFNQLVFDSVPKDAIIITEDDPSTFGLWYSRFVEGQRVDTSIIAEGLLGFDWYRQTLRTTYLDLEIPELSNLSPFNLITNNPKHPYCMVGYQDKPEIDCFHF